jgi:hypothetical protein
LKINDDKNNKLNKELSKELKSQDQEKLLADIAQA